MCFSSGAREGKPNPTIGQGLKSRIDLRGGGGGWQGLGHGSNSGNPNWISYRNVQKGNFCTKMGHFSKVG